MKKLIFFMHASLDGYVAGINGELNWVALDDEMFEFVAEMIAGADTALYGRVTFEMMQAYWPNAGKKPNATKHDIEHSAWYNGVDKIVLSRTINADGLSNTTVLNNDLEENINSAKSKGGKNILIFGSPGASHSLLSLGLVDEFWIFLNPILLGKGMPLFTALPEAIKLVWLGSRTFPCGVIAVHYGKK